MKCVFEGEECHLKGFFKDILRHSNEIQHQWLKLCQVCQMFKLRREILRLRATGIQT